MIRLGRATWMFAIVTTLALCGCGGVGSVRTASGNAASTRVDTTGVTRVEVADGFDVKLALGRPELAVVTYDDNLSDLLDVRVEGSTLRVRLKPHGLLGNPTLRADVTVQRLESIHTAGGASVTTTATVQNSGLQLALSGGSRITAAVGVDRMSATLSGASRATLTGMASALTADASGASDLALAELRLHDLDVQLSGASHAEVQVDDTVAADLSGASVLTYRGNPRFIKRETSGASTIQGE